MTAILMLSTRLYTENQEWHFIKSSFFQQKTPDHIGKDAKDLQFPEIAKNFHSIAQKDGLKKPTSLSEPTEQGIDNFLRLIRA